MPIHMISVIIATKNRPSQLRSLLVSLSVSTYKNFEIIVVEQNTKIPSIHNSQHLSQRNITFINIPTIGKARALNAGMQAAKGDIYAFTDDDCIVTPNWLKTINKTFLNQKQVSAIFGKTHPYQPKKHQGNICPSIFIKSKRTIITHPCPHFLHIGFGNNMAIRRAAINSVGLFKPWLGPGSVGSNAEDAEMALRLLIQKHRILFEPTMRVFHNRWITKSQMFTQTRSYTCGETACYGYFAFQGYAFAIPVIRSNIGTIIRQIVSGKHLAHECRHLLSSIWGCIVGAWHAWRDPITQI